VRRRRRRRVPVSPEIRCCKRLACCSIQVAEYMSKLTAAENDASKHQAEALKARNAVLQAQQDVDSLRYIRK
jgi:hypothetical protein